MRDKILLIIIVSLAFFLRIYNVTQVPPGLYQDEPPLGNNAYSLLKTGKGEFGDSLFFESFSDPRMPVYVYSTEVSIALFGKNDFAIRFPSVLAGTLTVFILYFFVKNMVLLDKNLNVFYKKWLPLLSSFILAFLPWHVQFSRAGFEATEGLFFFLLGNYLLLKFIQNKRAIYLFLFSLSIALSAYSYNAYRVIAVLNFVLPTIYLFWNNSKLRKIIIFSYVFLIVIALPIIIFSFTEGGEKRFLMTSAFSELKQDSFLGKMLEYPALFVKNYVSYFSFNFLLSQGDGIGRHQMPNFGLIFKWQLLPLLLGIYFLAKNKLSISVKIIFFLAFISPIAASLTVPSPHSLRSLSLCVPLVVIISFGILYIFEKLKRYYKIILITIFLVAGFEFAFYEHYYFVHYPQVNLLDWGGSYKEIVQEANKISTGFDEIVVDPNLSFLPDYARWYAPYLKFSVVGSDWKKPKNWADKKILYIRPYYGEIQEYKLIKNIYLPNKFHDIFSQFWSV